MKSKIWVELIIDGFEISPNELTSIVGVEPSSITKKGDTFITPKGKTIIEPFNAWILKSGCTTSENLEEQIEVLISKLKPFKKEFLEFCKKYPPDFNIVIHVFKDEAYPYIGFENRQVIKDLSLLNATFGIDYSFYEKEENL